MRLRRQAGWSWRRSKRQSAFYLQARPTTHIVGRADTHPDALPPGSEGVCPPRPCEPMGASTIAAASSALHTNLHTNASVLQIMLIMLNYAAYANLCLRDAKFMLNVLSFC